MTLVSVWNTSSAESVFSKPRPLLHKTCARPGSPLTLRHLRRPLSHRSSLVSVPRLSSPLLLPTTTPSPSRTFFTTPPAMSDAGFYSLKATAPGNKPYEFEQLKGKVVLIVNTASKW